MAILDIEAVVKKMMGAGAKAFGAGWKDVKQFAPAEFHKIAVQLKAISANVSKFQKDPTKGYSPQTGALLIKMQRDATESVLVAFTALTLIAVQKAIDAVLKVVKDAFGGVLGLVL